MLFDELAPRLDFIAHQGRKNIVGLDGVFDHADEQTPKLRANLAEFEERVRKNRELMTLRHDAPVDDVDFDGLGVSPDAAEVRRLFDFLEFRTLGSRLDEAFEAMVAAAPGSSRPRGSAFSRASSSSASRAANSSGLVQPPAST